ncbi:MAG: hypothetical protein Q4G59_06805, partial [Planctomycetia bacterium]|nr:hypothetical protein [Planctomycetia bacterium]
KSSKAKSNSEPFIVVPCEGNSLVLLDRDGQPIKKVTPRAASGELVNIVRSYRGKEDKVFFVASARKLSRLVHRFDGRLEELGTLDIGSRKNQKVADLALADLNTDGTPELLLGLLGDSVSNELPVHGLYAVDLLSQNILWKDENIFAPGRIGFEPTKEPSGKDAKNKGKLLALNLPEGVAGGLVEDETSHGGRLNELLMDDGSSIQWFGAESLRGDGQIDLVVLCVQQEPSRLFLAGIANDRSVRWKSILPIDMISPQLDTITTGDVDGDGVKDWIVLSPDGLILFYSANGDLIDQFQYGAEITGACVVHRGKERFLVVTDVDGITAWRFK